MLAGVHEQARETDSRRPTLFALGGAATAAVALVLAGAAGPPYLSLAELNPWLVVYAIGLFASLFATPFALHRGLGGLLESDARWERALLWWGAVAVAALAIGVLLGAPSGFASDSLAGSAGLVAAAEAVLVLGTLVVWLVSG
jgi:hypothetical protein